MSAMMTARLMAVVALAVLGTAQIASAQLRLGGLNLEGTVEGGIRYFIDEPKESRKGKLEEYRDLSQGLFAPRLDLRLFRPDESYSVDFSGRNIGREDQEFSLGAGRLGLWQFGFDWDQTPHIFSTNTRLLATERTRGEFVLPTTRPNLNTYNGASRHETGMRTDTARLSFLLTPTPDLELKAEYTLIDKDGDRPMGMAFGSPGGNFFEILEPIEQKIHDFRLRGTLSREQWQLQFGYTLSVFENSVTSLIADNPCRGLAGSVVTGAGCGATDGGAAAPSRGRTALAPDNMAHSINLAGGVSLPMRTRVTANLGYSLRLQNADFLPHTINPALTSPPLLQRSLNGNVQTILLNLNATSRPISPLTLSAKYRLYDLHDLSDQVSSTGTVVNDRTVSSPRRSSVWDYSRQNFDGDARWQLFRPLALTLGGGWERWHRNQHREARLTDEATGKAAIDATPVDWILARLTYRPSFRRVYQYHTEAHAEHSVNEEDPSFDTQKQSQSLVKFDEGSRNRHRVDVLFQLTPTEFFTVTPTASYYTDDYIDSDLGLQKGTGWSAGIDLNWTPFERVAISAGYMHERIEQGMRSRFRPTVGGVIADFESFDWISWNIDTIDTIHAGVKATLIPKVLDLTLGGNYSSSVGRIETRNPAAPSESTTANQLSAQAKPMPAFEDTLLRLDTKLTYHFAKAWSASLGYVFESLVSHDWRTDRLNPFIPGISSIWLGDDQRNYAAHIVGATLAYRFK